MFKAFLIAIPFGLLVAIPLFLKDEKGYAALVKSSEPQEMRSYCRQFREGVSKTLFGDVNCQLTSNHSELFFFLNGKEMELIEELDAIDCLVCERTFEREGKKWQTVRRIQADSATYHYNRSLLQANQAHLCTYEIPSEKLPSHLDTPPLMEGEAKVVEVQLEGREFSLIAENFEGKLP